MTCLKIEKIPHFTNGLKYHIKSALENFGDLVRYESISAQGKIQKYMNDGAYKLIKIDSLYTNVVRNRFRKKNMHWSTENEDNNDEDESDVEKPKVSRPRKKPKALELDHKKKIKSKKGTERVSNRINNDKKGSDAKEGKLCNDKFFCVSSGLEFFFVFCETHIVIATLCNFQSFIGYLGLQNSANLAEIRFQYVHAKIELGRQKNYLERQSISRSQSYDFLPFQSPSRTIYKCFLKNLYKSQEKSLNKLKNQSPDLHLTCYL
ncbi:hypothetical protein BpHYR1_033129 [Brachionus plicatilis]|uniref:Uncharacterized protein n=1 Tax=Brachionus plicatilis TaxID=10195 RepID=A0A3M7SUI2_BRAPC|nr:hypothetical protein BpHYR1_033129 [Brachionus plicatilis]